MIELCASHLIFLSSGRLTHLDLFSVALVDIVLLLRAKFTSISSHLRLVEASTAGHLIADRAALELISPDEPIMITSLTGETASPGQL